jgi:hypothetical protein
MKAITVPVQYTNRHNSTLKTGWNPAIVSVNRLTERIWNELPGTTVQWPRGVAICYLDGNRVVITDEGILFCEWDATASQQERVKSALRTSLEASVPQEVANG